MMETPVRIDALRQLSALRRLSLLFDDAMPPPLPDEVVYDGCDDDRELAAAKVVPPPAVRSAHPPPPPWHVQGRTIMAGTGIVAVCTDEATAHAIVEAANMSWKTRLS